jgi:hypothetical protein
MDIVKVRPEHLANILRIFDVEKGLRAMLIKSEYKGYSRDVLLANLHLFNEGNSFEIVPSIDDFCDDCPNQNSCKESDANLFTPFTDHLKRLSPGERRPFLKKSLTYIDKTNSYLALAFPFTFLIGNIYSLKQLRYIGRNPELILDMF